MADMDFAINFIDPALLASDAPVLAGRRLDTDDEATKQVARDFESILMTKLVDAMSHTIPDSGLFDDGVTKQIKDMFWSFLAQDVGERGGIGMWRDIYRQIRSSGSEDDSNGATMEQLL